MAKTELTLDEQIDKAQKKLNELKKKKEKLINSRALWIGKELIRHFGTMLPTDGTRDAELLQDLINVFEEKAGVGNTDDEKNEAPQEENEEKQQDDQNGKTQEQAETQAAPMEKLPDAQTAEQPDPMETKTSIMHRRHRPQALPTASQKPVADLQQADSDNAATKPQSEF